MDRLRALSDVLFADRNDFDPSMILAEANKRLVTHHLHDALSRPGRRHAMPDDGLRFLEEVAARNTTRNARLHRQLEDAVILLNRAGIEPVLLKGAGELAAVGPGTSRILSDLDLLVEPARAREAAAVLISGGFERYDGSDDPRAHVVAELSRPSDPGGVDLHQRAAGPPGFIPIHALRAEARRLDIGGGTALLPSPRQQVVMLALHDFLHDGGLWSGRLHLRHLIDLRGLAEAGAVDPGEVLAQCPTRLSRRVVACLMLLAIELTGAPIPLTPAVAAARGDLRRLMAQNTYPRLARPLGFAAYVVLRGELSEHRRGIGRMAGSEGLPPERQGPRARLRRLRQLTRGV